MSGRTTIDAILGEKCIWWIALQHGTIFQEAGRTPENLLCYQCNGYKRRGQQIGCENYTPDINEIDLIETALDDYVRRLIKERSNHNH